MKYIMFQTYHHIALPEECLLYLPKVKTIEAEGYGGERKLFEKKQDLEFILVDASAILQRSELQAVPPTPLTEATNTDCVGAPAPEAPAGVVGAGDEDDLPF